MAAVDSSKVLRGTASGQEAGADAMLVTGQVDQKGRRKGTKTMQTIRVLERTGKDGMLHLDIPLGKPEAEFEVVVVVQPKETSARAGTLEERGWPPGYFENTFGSITDETFVRPLQGELPKPVELE
jgi:hypothetical protein